MSEQSPNIETATLGGGCFWCIEAIFEQLKGVQAVVSGYANGHIESPTYEEVCTGQSGHAEVVQVHFDPQEISYEKLLETFFKIHDPTTLNQQGADTGTQYRSTILFHNESQQTAAEFAKTQATELWTDPIITEIKPLNLFYEAEAYHQDYFRNNPNQPYCAAVIAPKLEKLNPLV
ncbi:MAG: peptide-methionine (S)-S-oxide reductase MsrA [Opitutae bacterium]|nr:peptide-methionine (S)-S-oxide reductase MsrA [Opitutae bacterium]MBT6464051.1 peptide-methionine (S)-S-oxide reductase MsrA [Opitutae bacterium]MBT6958509.1 peptide-methionine (S)-S-oxide reductase MsrA [Opitutae bacterium]MBT7854037.1 peptide-methionine (S)-S-oxide reductase MsrA [Opitutae bacterium]